MQGIGLKTYQVGFGQSIEATVRKLNAKGVVIKVRASDFTQPLGRMSAKANEFTKSLEASNARVIAFGASAAIIGGVTTAFSQLVIQAAKVEKILGDINAVLNTSVTNLQKFGDGLFKVARNTSQSLEVAAEAALEFSRQGLTMEETLKRTNDALILTRLTGLKAADSVKGLTAAVNGFADAGLTTTQIINKLAAVDVKFAVSADDLINALARAGAVAQDAGVSFNQLIGAVTAAQQITARGGSVIGNSFKTIFTRIQRSSTVDRLQELGIAVKDIRGQTLPALTVLKNLSDQYDKLAFSTKAAVAEQVGGVFQINILKAALKDLSKESSIYSQATLTSANATNEAQIKNAQLQKTLASIANQTLTSVRELTANLGDLTLAPALKEFLEAANKIVGFLSDALGSKEGESLGGDFAKGFAKAIGNVLAGPGMFVLVMIFSKLFAQAFKFAKNSVKDLLQIQSIKEKERAIQESIVDAMMTNTSLAKELINHSGNKAKQEEIVLKLLQEQTKQIEMQRKIAKNIAPGLRRSGVQPNLIVETKKTASSGLIPAGPATPMEARKERAGAARGGYAAGPVSTMSIPNMGRVVYNKNETVRQFQGMRQPAIMPPENSIAGRTYRKDFSGKHGFNPYQSAGYIPNFARGDWARSKSTSVGWHVTKDAKGKKTFGLKGTEMDLMSFAQFLTHQGVPRATAEKITNQARQVAANAYKKSKSAYGEYRSKYGMSGSKRSYDRLNKAQASILPGGIIPIDLRGINIPDLKGKLREYRTGSTYSDKFGYENNTDKYWQWKAGSAGGLIPNYNLAGGLFSASSRMGRGRSGPKTKDISYLFPDVGGGPSALLGHFKDIVKQAKLGKPYKHLNVGDVIGPRVPKLLVEGKRLLDKARLRTKIPKMTVSGNLTPSILVSKIDGFAEDRRNGFIHGKVDYMPAAYGGVGEEEEVRRYLKLLGLDPKDSRPANLNKLYKERGGFSKGFVPNYVLEAMRLSGTNILRLPKAKMITETTKQNFKGVKHTGWRNLEASIDNVKAHAASYAPQLEELKRMGIDVIHRKMYFANQTSHVPKNEMRAISRNQKKFAKAKKGSYLHANQHNITGSSYEGALDKHALGRLGFKPTWAGSYTPKGMKSGAGDMKGVVDFVRPGRLPLETKYGKYTPANLIAKSIRLYSDRYIENFLSKNNQYGLAAQMSNSKLGDSQKLMKYMGYSSTAKSDVLHMGLSSGFIPNFMLEKSKNSGGGDGGQTSSKNHFPSGVERLPEFIPNYIRSASFKKRADGKVSASYAYHMGNNMVFKPFAGQSADQKKLKGKTAFLSKNKRSIEFDTIKEASVLASSLTKRVTNSGPAIAFNVKPGHAYERAIADTYVKQGWTGVGPDQLDFFNTKWSTSTKGGKLKTPLGKGAKALTQYWKYADAYSGSTHGPRPVLEKLMAKGLVTQKMIQKAMETGTLDLTKRIGGLNFAEIIGVGNDSPFESSVIFNPLNAAQGVNKRTFGNLQGALHNPVGSPYNGKFRIKFKQDHFTALNKPSSSKGEQELEYSGLVPNFAAWNPFTTDTKAIARQGGLIKGWGSSGGNSALANIIKNSPFRDLLARHKHWNLFPKKHKKRLNDWLRKQGYTNRALQGWGLLSKNSKSIAGGVNDLAAHSGHIPNFSNPLIDAISREKNALKESGSSARVYVDQDDRLKNIKNPMGLLVANTRDEPSSGSQGVNRAINMGLDPKTHGASSGVTPNFQFMNKNGLNVPTRGPSSSAGGQSSSSSTGPTKDVEQASSDMMMKMMGLTTLMYAFEGAMGGANEEASGFVKSMKVLNSVVMGVSQAAMISMMMTKGTFGAGVDKVKKSMGGGSLFMAGAQRTLKGGGAGGGRMKGVGAMARGAGGALKGIGGMAMGILGPLGIAAALLIPIFSALKDNLGWFTSASEKGAKAIESANKNMDMLSSASANLTTKQETNAQLSELEALGKHRSAEQEHRYHGLKLKSIKSQTKFDSSIGDVKRKFDLTDDQLARLNGSYDDQINVLQELEIAQARYIGVLERRKTRREDLKERTGDPGFFGNWASDIGETLDFDNDMALTDRVKMAAQSTPIGQMFSQGFGLNASTNTAADDALYDMIRVSGQDSGETAEKSFNLKALKNATSSERNNFSAGLKKALTESGNIYRSNVATEYGTFEGMGQHGSGLARSDFFTGGKDFKSAKSPLDDFIGSNRRFFGNDAEVSNFIKSFQEQTLDMGITETKASRNSGDVSSRNRGVSVALEGFIEGVTRSLGGSGGSKNTTIDNRGSIASAKQLKALVEDRLTRELDFAAKKLDIEKQMLELSKKRAKNDMEIEGMFRLVGRDEKIKSEFDAQRRFLTGSAGVEEKSRSLEAGKSILKTVQDTINKDIINKNILDETVGLRLDYIAGILLDQNIKDEIANLEETFEKDKNANIQRLTKQLSEVKQSKHLGATDEERMHSVIQATIATSGFGTNKFNSENFENQLEQNAKALNVGLKALKDRFDIDFDHGDNDVSMTFDQRDSKTGQVNGNEWVTLSKSTNYNRGTIAGNMLNVIKGQKWKQEAINNKVRDTGRLEEELATTKSSSFDRSKEMRSVLARNYNEAVAAGDDAKIKRLEVQMNRTKGGAEGLGYSDVQRNVTSNLFNDVLQATQTGTDEQIQAAMTVVHEVMNNLDKSGNKWFDDKAATGVRGKAIGGTGDIYAMHSAFIKTKDFGTKASDGDFTIRQDFIDEFNHQLENGVNMLGTISETTLNRFRKSVGAELSFSHESQKAVIDGSTAGSFGKYDPAHDPFLNSAKSVDKNTAAVDALSKTMSSGKGIKIDVSQSGGLRPVTMGNVLEQATQMGNSDVIKREVDTLKALFFRDIKALKSSRNLMFNEEGEKQAVTAEDVATILGQVLASDQAVRSGSIEGVAITQMLIKAINSQNAQAGVTSLTTEQVDKLVNSIASASATKQNEDALARAKAQGDFSSLSEDERMAAIKGRSMAGLQLLRQQRGGPQDLTNLNDPAVQQYIRNLIQSNFNAMNLDANAELGFLSEERVTAGARLGASKKFIEGGKFGMIAGSAFGNKSIDDQRLALESLETLKSQNKVRENSENLAKTQGLLLDIETEKKLGSTIDLQNLMNLHNYRKLLLDAAKINLDNEMINADNSFNTVKAKQDYLETYNKLNKQAAQHLRQEEQQRETRRRETTARFSQRDSIILDSNSRFFGQSYRASDIAGGFSDQMEQRANDIKDARFEAEYMYGRGNSLRGSEARLQMLQLQKEQNIDQGKTRMFSDTIAVRIAEVNTELERFGETLANTTFDSVQQGFKDLVQAMADGTKSMGDAFLGFVGNIVNAVHEKLMDRASKQITSALFDSMGLGSISANYNGGLIKGFASGGHTGGKTPAMLTAGEYVVRKKVVDRLGVSSLDRINQSGDIDSSLTDLYDKPNDSSIDISTSGSAAMPPMMRFNEGGYLNSAIAKVSQPVIHFNAGGWNNPFKDNADDSNAMRFAKGTGYMTGSMVAAYEGRQKPQYSGPEAPRSPNETRLNTTSALNIDPTSRMMSARYRQTDEYSKKYGDYLLAKYQADVDYKNARVMDKANQLKGIVGGITGSLIAHGVTQGMTAIKGAMTARGSTEDFRARLADKGIHDMASFRAKDPSLFEASRKGHNIRMSRPMTQQQREEWGTDLRSLEMRERMGNLDADNYAGLYDGMKGYEIGRNGKIRGRNDLIDRSNASLLDVNKRRNQTNVAETKVSQAQQAQLDSILHTQGKSLGFDFLREQKKSRNSGDGMSGGGRVFGPSGRDQVGPVMLDKGEYVIRASSVDSMEKKYPGFFDRLNSMRMNEGGPVSPSAASSVENTTNQNSSSNVTVNINISSGGQASVDGGGAGDQAFAAKIKDAVVGVIAQEKRVGGMLNGQ